MPVCAMTVPRRPGDAPAEAVDEPHVEDDVEAEPPTAATSGVRVSCRPRRTPVVARTTSIAGMPIAEIRR